MYVLCKDWTTWSSETHWRKNWDPGLAYVCKPLRLSKSVLGLSPSKFRRSSLTRTLPKRSSRAHSRETSRKDLQWRHFEDCLFQPLRTLVLRRNRPCSNPDMHTILRGRVWLFYWSERMAECMVLVRLEFAVSIWSWDYPHPSSALASSLWISICYIWQLSAL